MIGDVKARAFKPRFEPRPDPELLSKLPKWIQILYELAEEAGVAECVFTYTCDHDRGRRGQVIMVEARG